MCLTEIATNISRAVLMLVVKIDLMNKLLVNVRADPKDQEINKKKQKKTQKDLTFFKYYI